MEKFCKYAHWGPLLQKRNKRALRIHVLHNFIYSEFTVFTDYDLIFYSPCVIVEISSILFANGIDFYV